jgi:hypothetical protein
MRRRRRFFKRAKIEIAFNLFPPETLQFAVSKGKPSVATPEDAQFPRHKKEY